MTVSVTCPRLHGLPENSSLDGTKRRERTDPRVWGLKPDRPAEGDLGIWSGDRGTFVEVEIDVATGTIDTVRSGTVPDGMNELPDG